MSKTTALRGKLLQFKYTQISGPGLNVDLADCVFQPLLPDSPKVV
jgi:hypothetical protein